jgi:excisionase family DNA binding protein
MRSHNIIPLRDLAACTVDRATKEGIGKTSIYEAINDGRLLSTKVGRRRLIVVSSLMKLVGADQEKTT